MAATGTTRSVTALVAEARGGDQAAFAALIQRYYPMVQVMCARVLGDQDQALDITQEAAVAAMLGLDRLRRDDRFGAWLAGIGLNLCRRVLRDRDWAAFSLDAALGSGSREPADDRRGPAEALEAAEVARRVRDAIGALPAGQRRAAESYYLSGLSTAEAASHLGIPVSAVKSRLHKARAALRASLADYQPERHIAMTPPSTAMIPVTITGAVELPEGKTRAAARTPYYIMLTETGGDRRLWIGVGKAEAYALALSLSGSEMPRPLTYQFTAAILAAAGGQLAEIRITSLTNGVFFAQAVLTSGAIVDARPSDALNLAAITRVPVYAAGELLDLYTRPPLSAAARQDWIQLQLTRRNRSSDDPGPAPPSAT